MKIGKPIFIAAYLNLHGLSGFIQFLIGSLAF
jgi:hypothetical protein